MIVEEQKEYDTTSHNTSIHSEKNWKKGIQSRKLSMDIQTNPFKTGRKVEHE